MKKLISLLLACVLMCAVLVPCYAAGEAKRAKYSSITLGMWPQSRVTNEKDIALLNKKLADETGKLLWIQELLPDGTAISYYDVPYSLTPNPFGISEASNRPTYRAVRVNGSAVQWYRWEPLTWHIVTWHSEPIYVCDSLVAAVSCTGANPAALDSAQTNAIRAWLASDFFSAAFSTAEKNQYIRFVLTPTVSMTQGFTAAVGDYVALSGANGANYFKTVDPVVVSDPNTVTTDMKPSVTMRSSSAASNVVGVLPIIVPISASGGGLINWIMKLFGH